MRDVLKELGMGAIAGIVLPIVFFIPFLVGSTVVVSVVFLIVHLMNRGL